MGKVSTLEQAQKIVAAQNQIERLETRLGEYSMKGLDGKLWSINTFSDSRHYAARDMVTSLPQEDRTAINKYIVRRVRAAIKRGKQELTDMGIET